jgi:hypothetical protein
MAKVLTDLKSVPPDDAGLKPADTIVFLHDHTLDMSSCMDVTILDQYPTMITLLGAPMDYSMFYYPAFMENDSDAAPLERYNVDRNLVGAIAYHKMVLMLCHIHSECAVLPHCFTTVCKTLISLILHLGDGIDITDTKPNITIETAEEAVGLMYMKMKDSFGRMKKHESGVIAKKRQ